MSQACFPDPAHSRALLIGASHFTAAGPDLPDIPAVQANLTALRQVLTSSDLAALGGWAPVVTDLAHQHATRSYRRPHPALPRHRVTPAHPDP